MLHDSAVGASVDQELRLEPISYKDDLNSRQKENYNFQKVSALLADYGYCTIRLSDDWQGADFIALHIRGRFLRVQLKGRLRVDTKYRSKEIWMCFQHGDTWFLYPHDLALRWALVNTTIIDTEGWTGRDFDTVEGAYDWPNPPPKKWLGWLAKYAVPPTNQGLVTKSRP